MTVRPRSLVTSWAVIDRHYRSIATALRNHATGFRSGMHLLLGLLVSGLFFHFALHGVKPAQVWRELQLARPVPLALAIGVAIACNLFRALRWRVILGDQTKVPLRFFFSSMMIGYLANNLLPARLGELVRIYTLERKAGVCKSTSAATVILERTTDTLVLLALVIGTSYFLPLPPSIRSASRVGLAVFAAFAAFLIFLAIRGKNLVGLAIRNMNSLWFRAGHKLPRILETFINGLSVFRRSEDALLTFALTLVIWGMEAVSVALVMTSLGLSLPWIASLLLVLVVSLSSIIPAAPGAVGTYEFFAVTALAPFAVQSSQSIGLALALHGVAYVTSTALGLGCLWAESLSLGELLIKAPEEVQG